MEELVEHIKSGSDEDSTLSTFIKLFEHSPIIPTLYKMIDNYDTLLEQVMKVNTRDIGVEALNNHEMYIGDVLYRIAASIEFTLYMAGRRPDKRVKSDRETYDRFIDVITNKTMLTRKKITKKRFSILHEGPLPPTELFVWNFLSTISSIIMLNGLYTIGKGADIEGLEEYFISLFRTFRYVVDDVETTDVIRDDLLDYYSQYVGMNALDYTTSLYSMKQEVTKLMSTFNLYGLNVEDRVLNPIGLQYISFTFFSGIAITRV